MLPRFQHILVPLDFTYKNQAALDIAFEIGVQNQTRVTLLHVIETIGYGEDEEINEFYARLEAHANSELESTSQRFSEAGLAVGRKLRFGKRAREIVQDAIDRQVDLIILHAVRNDTFDRLMASRRRLRRRNKTVAYGLPLNEPFLAASGIS